MGYVEVFEGGGLVCWDDVMIRWRRGGEGDCRGWEGTFDDGAKGSEGGLREDRWFNCQVWRWDGESHGGLLRMSLIKRFAYVIAMLHVAERAHRSRQDSRRLAIEVRMR